MAKKRAGSTPAKKLDEKVLKGRPGTEIWLIPPDELGKYHEELEEIQEELIDLDAQLQKDKAKVNRRMEMHLVDLAKAAGVPIGTPASVQGRYFVESKGEPQGQRVVQRQG